MNTGLMCYTILPSSPHVTMQADVTYPHAHHDPISTLYSGVYCFRAMPGPHLDSHRVMGKGVTMSHHRPSHFMPAVSWLT